VVWKLPVYNNILVLLTSPLYAGAYAYGRTETRTRVVQGQAHKTEGHRKPPSQWTALIRDHHAGYISWEQ
jgi:Recombinase